MIHLVATVPAQPEPGFWALCFDVFRQHGVIALVLIGICFLFYKLIWKVWNTAILSKDQEIERLVKERDKYQNLVFERLLSSDPKDKEKGGKK